MGMTEVIGFRRLAAPPHASSAASFDSRQHVNVQPVQHVVFSFAFVQQPAVATKNVDQLTKRYNSLHASHGGSGTY